LFDAVTECARGVISVYSIGELVYSSEGLLSKTFSEKKTSQHARLVKLLHYNGDRGADCLDIIS